MKWFRWHVGACEDGKFRFVAMKAHVTTRDAIAVWAMLLEDAAADEHRGVCCRAASFVAAILDFDESQLQAVLAAMAELRMISVRQDGSIAITNWGRRQFESDTTDPTAATRAKRYRDRKRKRSATPPVARHGRHGASRLRHGNRHAADDAILPIEERETSVTAVTHRDAAAAENSAKTGRYPDHAQNKTVTRRDATVTQRIANGQSTDSESESESESAQPRARDGPPDAAALPEAQARSEFERVEAVVYALLPDKIGWRVRADLDFSAIHAAMRDGANLELDVVPAIRAQCRRALDRGKNVGSWRYFEAGIREHHESRRNALGSVPPAPVKGSSVIEPKTQRSMLKLWQMAKFEVWNFETPAPGKPGCLFDHDIVREFGIDPHTGKHGQEQTKQNGEGFNT